MKNIYLTLMIAIIAGITLTGGDCDETTGTGGGTQNDPNVLEYNNLVVREFFNDNSPNGINLLQGLITTAISSEKDVVLDDSLNLGQRFYLNSGDNIFDINPVGYVTKFGQFIEWSNISQSQWDTLSRVWKSSGNADTISAFDFSNDDTRYPGSEYFGIPLSNHTVYAFYLQGKYQNGITSNPVFGMIYLDSAWNAGGNEGFSLQVDVKINIAGRNQFLQQVPIQ